MNMLLLLNVLSFWILLLRLFTGTSAVEPTRISTVRTYKLEFFEGGKAWEISQKACQERDSWLVEIKLQEIFDAVMKLKKHHIIWIGAYYVNGWTWNRNSSIHYEKWRSGYPSGVSAGFNNGCGLMQEDGSWINIDCSKGYRYICQSDLPSGRCPEDHCSNKGICEIINKKLNCTCELGYFGTTCEKDRVVVRADRLIYTTVQNQNVVVSLRITSNHGSVKIEVYKGSFSAGVFLTQRNITDSATFNTGPLMDQTEGVQYIFKATPESDPGSYYKFISVTVIVQGPPSIASIRDKVLSLPTETSIVVQCNASGVPRPNITWKKDGVEVNTIGSNPVYQTKGVKFSNLNFKSDARTEVGHYTCYADNEIGNGEKKSVHESIFVGGKINLVGNTTKNPESAFDTITLSCTFEGYPAPNIFWKWGDGKKIPRNNTGSIFTIHTVVQSDSPLVRKKSSLHITLVEFLGARNVFCHSRNTYGNNTGARFSLNENLLIGNNRSYRLYAGNNENMNYYDALTYCKDSRRSLVKILDNKTQYFIADKLSTINLTTKILIGAQKQYMRAVKLWKWFDGKIFYNESKYGSDQNVYPDYSAWHGGKPNGIGNCAVLNLDNQWLWTPEPCNLANGFICESEVAGVPRDLKVIAEICRSNVNVSWVAAKEAVGVVHRIELHKVIDDSFSRVVSTQEVIPDKVGRFATHFFSLEKGTLYIVKVIVCPECPYPHTTSATVSTNELIPASTYEIASATVVQVMQSCVLSWSVNASGKGIFGYRITISTTLIHSASAKGRSWSAREEYERGHSIHKYSVSAKYNRKYTFSVQIRTCLNLGRPTEIVGSCLVERGPPSSVPQPITQVGNDGKPIVEIAIPDETNGPISCLFIVVIRGVSAIKNTNFGRTELTNAMVNAKSETLLGNDAYIAIAISRQDISAVIEQGINFTRSLGDAGAVSSCDIATDYSKRKRRSTTVKDVFEARNRDLPAGKSFGIITISTTPGDNGEIFFLTSERPLQYLLLSTVRSDLGSAAAPIIALSSLLLISLIAIAIPVLKLKNMKSQLASKEEKFQSDEEHIVRPYETTFLGSKVQQYENPDTTGRIEKPSRTEGGTASVGDQNPYEIAQLELEAQPSTYEIPCTSQVNANSPYEEVRL